MKRHLTLVLVLLVLAALACGGGTSPADTEDVPDEPSQPSGSGSGDTSFIPPCVGVIDAYLISSPENRFTEPLNDLKAALEAGNLADAEGHLDTIAYIDDSIQKNTMRANYGGRAISRGANGTKVDMVKLDTIMNEHPELNLDKTKLLKIDVEGAEPLVVFGARELIKKAKPVIFVEKFNTDWFLDRNNIWKTEIQKFRPFEWLLVDAGYHTVKRIKRTILLIP